MALPTKILVTDDELVIREVMKMVLEDMGYLVLTAEDGEEAWQIFLEERPDIVLSDLSMPKVDGFELLSRIAKEDQEVPIIVFSGVGTIEDILKALNLGAWDYLTKPIADNNVLRHILSKALEKRDLVQSARKYQQLYEEELEKRKNIEHQLLQAQKMVPAGQLAAGYDHEINTPQQDVSSNVDFLDEAYKNIIDLMASIEQITGELPEESAEKIRMAFKEKDWEFLAKEIPFAIKRSREGIDRISCVGLSKKS